MTTTTTDLLLEATDVSKTYGAVVALDHASARREHLGAVRARDAGFGKKPSP